MGVDGSLYITQDHLSSLYLLPAPEGVTSNLKVISLALMYNNIVVLDTTNKIYYLSTNSSQFQLYQGGCSYPPPKLAIEISLHYLNYHVSVFTKLHKISNCQFLVFVIIYRAILHG